MKKQRARKILKEKGYADSSAPDGKTMSEDDFHYSIFYLIDPRLLRKRYMYVMGGWILTGCFSIALTGLLVLDTYLCGAAEDATLRNWFFSGIAISAVFCIAQAQVLYGHIHWVWINVGVYCFCFLASLLSITYNPDIYLFSMSLLGPLIGLLILNSSRCRELRHQMIEIRHKREARIITLKQQGQWKWW
ncbi:hypothetical protein [Pseudomonas cedrina]|uniref:hypothetical protein n=1 Tax=Pseudomonas cedrina TaxID=651740 RepID=UPI00277D7A2A|nr:hypothetical protein [Pseudomonas cedrina]MDQ0653540.1 hypothetical protein [Pseudomonas cedrina]